MPGRVRFQTEYNSSFKGHSDDASKVARSPILKPRVTEQQGIEVSPSKDNDAGLKSSNVHIKREPPLQHKRIAGHNKNHNTRTTETTQQSTVTARENSKPNKSTNPIMQYAAEVDQAKVEANHQPKMVRFTDHPKFAGRESDNLRYLVLEPPMQRKRRSPYNFNHNILRTDTIPQVNGNSDEVEENGETAQPFSVDHKNIENAKRKLEFEQPLDKVEHVEKLLPANATDLRVARETNRKGGKVSRIQGGDVEKERRRKRSPAKEQRKKDLTDVKNKQNERVDRALQVKAGLQTIEPPLSKHPIQTEYQRQFAWKEAVRQEIHAITPVQLEVEPVEAVETTADSVTKKKRHKPFRSEYQLQFREYPLVKQTPDLDVEKQKVLPSDGQTEEKRGRAVVDKRLLHQSKNIQPLFFPHGKSSLVTEYKANFVGPAQLDEKKAAFQARISEDKTTKELMQPPDSREWFKEVLRLREKAESYKARTRETHYPTVFLASLDDDDSDSLEDVVVKESVQTESKGQNGIREHEPFGNLENGSGDTGSCDNGNGDTGSGDTENESTGNGKNGTKRAGNSKGEAQGAKIKLGNMDVSKKVTDVKGQGKTRKEDKSSNFIAKTIRKGTANRPYNQSRYTSKQRQDEETQTEMGNDADAEDEIVAEPRISSPVLSTSDESDSVMSLLKGRVDTARLKSGDDHRRHNLDRTTPLRGGAIGDPGPRLSSEVTAPVHDFRSLGPDTSQGRQKKWIEDRSNAVGSKTNIIRETRPVPILHQKKYRHDKYQDERNEGGLLLSDLDERVERVGHSHYAAKTYKQKDERPAMRYNKTIKPPRAFVQPSDIGQNVDDDLLSDTSMSARDSVISDVLERSRRRRDNFW